MGVVIDLKFIARRHVDNGAYPAAAFVLSGAIAHAPVALTEALLFASILYFMAGLTPDASRFFYFTYSIFAMDLFFRNMLIAFVLYSATLQAAQTFPMIIIAVLNLLAGFMIVPASMGWYKARARRARGRVRR